MRGISPTLRASREEWYRKTRSSRGAEDEGVCAPGMKQPKGSPLQGCSGAALGSNAMVLPKARGVKPTNHNNWQTSQQKSGGLSNPRSKDLPPSTQGRAEAGDSEYLDKGA